MARYIFIDNASGYIFVDTADLPGYDGSITDEAQGVIEAARCFNAELGYDPDECSYEVRYDRSGGDSAYTVYRADIGGSEMVPVVTNGQDEETIEAVERDCDRVCSLKVTWLRDEF